MYRGASNKMQGNTSQEKKGRKEKEQGRKEIEDHESASAIACHFDASN